MELDLSHYETEILRLHRQIAQMTKLLRDAQEAISRVSADEPTDGSEAVHEGESGERHGDPAEHVLELAG